MEHRTRLAQLTAAAHLSVRDFCAEYHRVGRTIGENAHVSPSQAKRWLTGVGGLPRSESRRVLEAWWKEPIKALFSPPPAAPDSTLVSSAPELLATTNRDAVSHAIASAVAVNDDVIEQIHTETRRTARAYLTTPPLELLPDLARLQRLAQVQLTMTRKPRQQTELYLALSQIAGLMSSVSWALGHSDVSEEQARIAHIYAYTIEQPSLCAWARALHVTAMFWSGRPKDAVELASTALDQAPRGTARVRLLSVRARAVALLGDEHAAGHDLSTAVDELAYAGRDELLDGIGGELGFSSARRALCASTVYITVGRAGLAEAEAVSAIAQFGKLPSAEQWQAGIMGAHVDLAAARTMQGDLTEAAVSLAPVFDLDTARRTEALAHRLRTVRTMLGAPGIQRNRTAVELIERIDDFGQRSLSRTTRVALPRN